jgi:cyclic pyranopterin monophosphate synthase
MGRGHETGLSHLDEGGASGMVDVGGKAESERHAVAEALVRMTPATAAALAAGDGPKGDVVTTARLAGIAAAKRAGELIPLAHPLPLTHAGVEVAIDPAAGTVRIEAEARCVGRTGVEMEAMSAAAVAALTVYDMAKALERGIEIESVRLLRKSGGASGTWERGRDGEG